MGVEGVQAIEIELLIEGVRRVYGYDFRDYTPNSFARRVRRAMRLERAATVSALQEKILHDEGCFHRFLSAVTVTVTAMFRDPGFFLALRRLVLPVLRSYPSVRIWCAGCASGEEAYSMAVLLEDNGLHDRYHIYATDIDENILRRAALGIYTEERIQKYAAAYEAAGGTGAFSRYYTVASDHAFITSALRDRITFATHNLVSDGSFNEFHVILCRNVLIYFNWRLQRRVHELLYGSLVRRGILCIGSQESLMPTPHRTDYVALDQHSPIYRRLA